jgi:ATP-dependent DNA ligase
MMTRFQPLAEQVRDELQVRSAILDGAIVSLDEERRHIFRRMLAGRGCFETMPSSWVHARDRNTAG